MRQVYVKHVVPRSYCAGLAIVPKLATSTIDEHRTRRPVFGGPKLTGYMEV